MRISRGVSLERAILGNGQREGTTRASRRMLYMYLVGASLLHYQKCTTRIDCSYLQIPDNYPAYLDSIPSEYRASCCSNLEYTTVMQEHLSAHIDRDVRNAKLSRHTQCGCILSRIKDDGATESY
jgi:hypothetical protein